jgi:hypothetical protein
MALILAENLGLAKIEVPKQFSLTLLPKGQPLIQKKRDFYFLY